MAPAITRFAQANAPRVRLAGFFFLAFYIATRLLCLIYSPETNSWMWTVFFFEGLWTYHSLSTDIPRQPGKTAKRLHLGGNHSLPSVDILLPCCGELVDIIRDTIRAICVIDYPQSAFRVLVLDDGNSIQLREAVEELRQTWSNVHYYSRGTKPNERFFAKAGNLNYGLFNIQGGMTVPPEFIAVFDADFLPAPNFLRATLPHLLGDDSIGLVGTGQDFYNLPPGDPLGQALTLLWQVAMPRGNELGASMVPTTGCVMRHDLALKIGGFPTINEMEDATLSMILPAYGKRAIGLEEMLQLGLVPSSLEGHVRQTRRWITGFTGMIATPWAPSRDSIPPAMIVPMALFGAFWLFVFLNQSVGCTLIIPALISGQPLVPGIFLGVHTAFSLVNFALVFLHEWLKAAGMGFGIPTFVHFDYLWMCADQMCTIIQFHVFGSLGGRSRVTGSSQNAWNNPNRVSTRVSQLKRDLWDSRVYFNLLFVLGSFGGILHSAMRLYEHTSDWQIHAMTTFLAPPVVFMCYITLSCHLIPLLCVVCPLRYPSRREVLGRHPSDSRAVFPSEAVRQRDVRQRHAPLGYGKHLLFVPVYLTFMALSCFVSL